MFLFLSQINLLLTVLVAITAFLVFLALAFYLFLRIQNKRKAQRDWDAQELTSAAVQGQDQVMDGPSFDYKSSHYCVGIAGHDDHLH